MRKRKVFLMIELDADEVAAIPPHLRGMLERPLVDPLTTRQTPAGPWFPTKEQERQKRRKAAAERAKALRDAQGE